MQKVLLLSFVSKLTPTPCPSKGGELCLNIVVTTLLVVQFPSFGAGLLNYHKIAGLLRVVSAIPTATTLAMTALQHHPSLRA
jgi:hypothetical protein